MISLALPLATDRLILREITRADTNAYAAMIAHVRMQKKTVVKGEEKNIAAYVSFDDGADAFIDFSLTTQRETPRMIYSLAVADKKTNAVIGTVELSQNDIGDIELGYAFHPDAQGNGFAVEACMALCSYAFTHGVPAVTATMRSDNKASKKLLQRLGMTLIGYKPTAYNDGMPIREYWMVERIPFLVAQNAVQQKTTAEAVA